MKVWKYYIDNTKTDTIFIEIKVNNENSRVFYNKEFIGTISNELELKKGELYECSVGEVFIKNKKNRLEVKLNNRHTINSVNQPSEQVSK